MALGVRQQGEIAYLRAALGLDELESRVAELENKESYEGMTLEARDAAGKAALLGLSGETYSPEGSPDPELEDQPESELHGQVDEDETVREANPAVQENPDLDALLLEGEENQEPEAVPVEEEK